MTDVQKVSRCKFCQGEITWTQDAVTGKNYPKNLNGTPHLCKKANQPAPAAPTQEQIAQEREEYNAKQKAAGFGAPAQEEKKDCTSTTPAPKPVVQSFKGTIGNVNTDKKILVVEDKDGIIHGLKYPDVLDVIAQKQKPGWFVEVEYVQKNEDEILLNVKYAERPPSMKRGSGSSYQQPRNEKLIAFLALHRDAMSGAPISSDQDYDAVMDMVYNRAKRDVEQAFKDFGGV